MRYPILGVIALMVLFGAGCSTAQTNTVSSTAADTKVAQNDQVPSNTTAKTYSLDEVAKHASASDCWMALSGKVYDMTKYIPNHPAGDKILFGCGKDATQMYGQIKDGKGHSSYASSLANDYYIGDLK